MLAIDDTYAAFCFDEACLAFGHGIEMAMDSVKSKGKKPSMVRGARENMLRRYLGIQPKFADIRALRGRGASEAKPERSEDRPEPNFRME